MKRESVHTKLDRMESAMIRGFDRVNSDISELKTDVSALKTDVSVLKTDVSVLKTDVSVLKTDVSVLKTDVSIMKVDIVGLKYNMSEMQEAFAGFKDKCYSHFDAIYNKLDFFKDEYHATNAGLRRVEDEHKIIGHKTILEKFQDINSRN